MAPFEVISEALQAWKTGDAVGAERLFERGIEAYRRREPDGLDFALGRYGAFLVAQGRKDDAARILERAVKGGTDIPAIWSDHMRLIAEGRNIESFKSAIESMASSVRYPIESEFILAHARRADREGATEFAKQSPAGLSKERPRRVIGKGVGQQLAITVESWKGLVVLMRL